MNKGFTLVELLVVLAISTFLVGMALVGTQGTQAQITLNAAAASFVSNINFVKNNAIAGSVSLGSLTANPNKNWVYGFAIFPGELSPTPPSNPGLCQTIAIQCSAGYYTAIIIKNINNISGRSACYDSSSNDSSPPVGNLLNSVNNLNSCAYPLGLISAGSIFPLTPSNSSTNLAGENWKYYNPLPAGVSISYQSSSSHEYFPVFQELTGYLYLYSLNSGKIVTNESTVFDLSYEGYTIPITFYDLYYKGSSNQSNTFSEGIISNG